MMPSAIVGLGALPLTPNGKLDRNALPEPTWRVEHADFQAPRTSEEATLAAIFAEVLRVPRVGINDNFFELGGDSILAIHLVTKAQRSGLPIAVKDIFAVQTVARLAELAEGEGQRRIRAEQGPVRGDFVLSPIYRRFLEPSPRDPHHYNMSRLLLLKRAVSEERLRAAFASLEQHHDALRLRFEHRSQDNRWVASFAEEGAASIAVAVHDLSNHEASVRSTVLTERCADAQASLSPENGPLARVLYFHCGAELPRLFIAIHHFAIDGVSWRILLEDLDTLLFSQEEDPKLPEKTSSLKAWAERLSGYANSEETASHLDFWLAQPWNEALRIPEPRSTSGEGVTIQRSLDPERTTALLTKALVPLRLRIDDALLAALACALNRSLGGTCQAVLCESHGRDMPIADLDVSRTVGWFTSVFPVLLDIPNAASLGERLLAAKVQLGAFSRHAWSYMLLRYLSEDFRDALAAVQPRIVFNYMGQQLSGRFEDAPEPRGPNVSPRARLAHTVTINSSVTGGRFCFSIHYDPTVVETAKAERLADEFLAELSTIASDAGDLSVAETSGESSSALSRASQYPRDQEEPRLVRIPNREFFPLSYTQSMFCHWERRHPGSTTWVNARIVILHGKIDTAVLGDAIDAAFDRHAVLRTWFPVVDGDFQQALTTRTGVLERIDLSSVKDPEQAGARVWSLLQDEFLRPIDLAARSFVRIVLATLPNDLHWFFIAKHHMVADGRLDAGLLGEILEDYTALKEGRSVRAPATDLRYVDYSAWRRATMATPSASAQLAHYKSTFDDSRPLSLPYDRAATSVRSPLVHQHPLDISPATWKELDILAREETASMFVVVWAALAMFLAEDTGQDDLTLIAPNRLARGTDPSLMTIYGQYTDYLVLRAKLAKGGSLRDATRMASAETLRALSHSAIPSSLVLGDPCPWDSPLARVLVNFAKAEPDAPKASQLLGSGLMVQPFRRAVTRDLRRTDLVWVLDGMTPGAFMGAADVFDRQTVIGLASRFSAFVTRAVSESRQSRKGARD
jgi:non-ribosomal peptide synthase protein (TIGR01720 family)